MVSMAASGITYTGRIYDSNNSPITSTNVRFIITIYDSLGKCWLYTEQRQLDLSQSGGTFSFDIGASDSSLVSGSAVFNNHLSPNGVKNMTDVFNNNKSFDGLGYDNGCNNTFTPNPSDLTVGRYLAIYFNVDGGLNQALPLLKINPVPSALTVAGYGTGELLKIDSSVNPSLNGNPNNGLGQTQYDEFWRLVKNPLSAYLPTSGDVTLVSGNNKITTILGQALPAGPATNGQVLVSNGTAWVLQSISSGSVSSVSANAPLSVGGTASAPVISLPAATTSVDGYLKSADWNTFNGKQSSSLVSGKVWIGNGSGLAEAQSLSGDAALAANGALTLATTTTAATKGTAQNVPQITYDAKGRITSVTEVAIDDNTKLAKSGGTMTGPIAMGAQDLTNTGNITMAANKYLGLSANSTDGTVAGQMWYDSGIIKYFDGTTVKSLGVAGAGITNFNGSSVASQTLAVPGTSGTAPNWSTNTGTGVHTLNIPMASTATVTAGLLSKTDYDRIGKAESLNGKAFDTTAASTMGQILYFDSAADKWKVSTAAAPTDGQVMKWNNTSKAWEPGNDSAGWTAVDASYAAKGIVQFQTDAATSGINVASGVATVVRTTTGQNSTILSLDGSGIANMYAAGIKGATSGTVTLQAPTTTANYSLTFPNVAPAAGQSLQSDASGNLSWASALTSINNSASLTSNNIWVGNASNKAVETAASSLLIMKGGQSGATSLGTTDANALSFLTNNSTRMTLTSAGNVGIGTSSPDAGLDLATGGQLWIRQGTGGALAATAGNGLKLESTTSGAVIQAYDYGTSSTKSLSIQGAGGYLGVGTLNPGAQLEVSKSLTADGSVSKITLSGSSANVVAKGLEVSATYSGTSSSLYGMDILANKSDTGVNAVYGINVKAQHNRTSGGTAAIHYGGKFVLTGPAAASTATGLTYYGIYGEANGATSGETSTVYGVYAKAVGPSTVIGFKSDVSGGSTNYAGIFTGGNVGVATQTPATALDVSGVTRSTGVDLNSTYGGSQVSVRAPAAFTSYTLTLPTSAGSANQVLATDGSGTLSWLSALTAVSNSASLTSNSIWVGNASNIATATAPSTLFVMKGGQTGAVSLGTTDATDLSLLTNNSAKVTVASGGNVGIGTTAPDTTLHVYSTQSSATLAPNQAGLIIEGEGTSFGGRIATRVYSDTESPIFLGYRALGTKAAPTAILNGKGLLTISARGYDGSAWSSKSSSPGITFEASEGWTSSARGSRINFSTTTNGTTSSLERMVIENSGDVAIGTSTPTARLTVSTTAASGNIASFVSTGAGGAGCSIAWNGTSCSSDARLKENIISADPFLMLDELMKVRPVHFSWKKDPQHQKQTGFIAQELEKIFPEFVTTDSNGYKQVNYAHFVSVLTASIQELFKVSQAHDRDIASVKAENARLKERADRAESETREMRVYLCTKDPAAPFCKK